MNVAIVGDSFLDKYCFGEVNRISPEAPIPVLDVKRKEIRSGGALNVALNLHGLGIIPTVFTIIDEKIGEFPFEIVSPIGCVSLEKTRFIAQNHQLLRVDEPQVYRDEDLKRMEYPLFSEFDIIAFVDYDKGIISGGKATIIDTKKKDLSVFEGTQILKINKKEYSESINNIFPQAFITQSEGGINYYENGKFIVNESANAKEVIDVSGAGDTVMAVVIYCLVNKINDPIKIMKLANKAAGVVISKVGTSAITLEEMNYE
jgi:rfaE bifunctional protein kinase chain/domain